MTENMTDQTIDTLKKQIADTGRILTLATIDFDPDQRWRSNIELAGLYSKLNTAYLERVCEVV